MWLTRVSILRPVTITMVVLAIVVLGGVSLTRLPVDLYPKMDFPFVTVIAVYAGAGPQEIETLITKPIEDAVSTISGVKNVTSNSIEGVGYIAIEFNIGVKTDTAASDVREKVDAVRMELPRDMDPPVIEKFSLSAMPVLSFSLGSPRPPKELRRVADDVIKDRLGKLKGVGSVSVSGGDIREIAVSVDKNALEGYGLTIGDVVQALQATNLNLPSGSVKEGRREYAVRAVGEFQSPDEIRSVRVSTRRGSTIYLSDVAQVADTVAERKSLARVDGKDSVTVTVLKQSDANSVQVADAVRTELQSLTGQIFDEAGAEVHYGARKPGITGLLKWLLTKQGYTRGHGVLPPDITARITMDQSTFIRDALHDLQRHLIFGALLAVLVVFFFLHNIRGTIIVALAIPTSIIATFTPIYFGRFSLNMMTMLALSLSVGILVDDSIVVIENIYRHLRLGEKPRDAAFNGRTEIGLAAITITLVDVVVFVPIAFMGGIVGMIFRQFGLTVAIATLFSLFVSFTLTPMLSSRWFREAEAVPDDEADAALPRNAGLIARLFHGFDRIYWGVRVFYRNVLAWALDHRLVTIIIGFVALLASVSISVPWPAKFGPILVIVILGLVGLLFGGKGGRVPMAVVAIGCALVVAAFYKSLRYEMFPRVDRGQITVQVDLPAGSSLAATDSVVRRLESFILDRKRFPELDSLMSTVNTSDATLSVTLVDKTKRERSDLEVVDVIHGFARAIPGATIKTSSYEAMGGHGGAPITIELSGSNMAELTRVADRIKARVAQMPGTFNVDTTWKVGKPELRAVIDRNRAADRNISTFQVASALRTSLEGDTTAKYREGADQYDIRVRLNEADRGSLDQVSNLVVGYDEGPVYLADIADVSLSTGPTRIDRKNRQRVVSVEADLARGLASGNMEREIQKAIADIPLGNVSLYFGGESEIRRESFGYTGQALVLSIILIYILMAALFEGYLSPFVIMFGLPMALVGALLAMLIAGKTLSLVTMIGIIMLMGLVSKNAILLVDYTNTLRSRGMDRRQALLEAGPVRLRPILMTTFAMVFGMLPVALATARGGEIRSPMAIAVIGGLILSMLLTLLVIPVLYTVFDNMAGVFSRGLRRLLARVFP